MKDTWFDGICNSCGSKVEEKSSSDILPFDLTKNRDYMNRCTNKECEHHRWHYCYDDEMLGYYEHKEGAVTDGAV